MQCNIVFPFNFTTFILVRLIFMLHLKGWFNIFKINFKNKYKELSTFIAPITNTHYDLII